MEGEKESFEGPTGWLKRMSSIKPQRVTVSRKGNKTSIRVGEQWRLGRLMAGKMGGGFVGQHTKFVMESYT